MDRVTREHAISILADYLRPLADKLASDHVQEIMINGPDDIWIEESGDLARSDIKLGEVEIKSAIEVMARLVGKDADPNTKDAIIDARLTGIRIAAALPPVSVKGPSISIRKHNPRILSVEEYIAMGVMPDYVAAQLIEAVQNHKNILIAGGTSSGKTTMLNALAAKIDSNDRILTIEDTQELKIASPNWVSLESNEQVGITIRDLVRLALRYRPDRIIVGEVRGAEAFDLLQALNTGHEGGFATIHANSAKSALSRLETLVLTTPGVDWPIDAVRARVADTFHFIVQLGRPNGKRRLLEVIRLIGFDYDKKEYLYEQLYSFVPR